ncbi:MAG: hypothetical protein SWO11_22015 [Thermodesulfobacteriota bacterium]|nr:hypothetical protein [Thermodesulfobacteriota bacterium]
MKKCNDCKFAEWNRTKTGRLHPSGDGQCKYPYKVPQLPGAFYWIGRFGPKPYGGFINRRKELKEHCAYYMAHTHM